jgi:hypothetical protein
MSTTSSLNKISNAASTTINNVTKATQSTLGKVTKVATDVVSDLNTTSPLLPQELMWTIRVVLVLSILFVAPNISKSIAMTFDNALVRVAIILVILTTAMIDPISAILIMTMFIVSMQTLQKYKLTNVLLQTTPSVPMTMSSPEELIAPETFVVDDEQLPVQGTVLSSEEMDDTVTCAFTNPTQFMDIQNNVVEGGDVNTEVKTWENQLGPQGLSFPSGYSSSCKFGAIE